MPKERKLSLRETKIFQGAALACVATLDGGRKVESRARTRTSRHGPRACSAHNRKSMRFSFATHRGRLAPGRIVSISRDCYQRGCSDLAAPTSAEFCHPQCSSWRRTETTDELHTESRPATFLEALKNSERHRDSDGTLVTHSARTHGDPR
jgi:hypothetical protein